MAAARRASLSKGQIAAAKCGVFILCAIPGALLLVALAQDLFGARIVALVGIDIAMEWFGGAASGLSLGADPIERLTRETGEWALKMLVVTLLITPIRRISGWNWLLKFRRMLGLWVFAYALAHFSIYVFLDRALDFSTVIEDVLDRKFITVGFTAFILLIPLAATSMNIAVRKLGGKNWLRLHRSVYAIAILAPIHFLWLQRGEDWSEPLTYAAIMASLLAVRFYWRRKDLAARRA